ncbi:unnamed protein product [Linum trigynum]|uniref:Uncharacterized protein n=1 Tax=Linum trigynum TaxID=586398 RepID=A0AAV2F8A6_9ROSI
MHRFTLLGSRSMASVRGLRDGELPRRQLLLEPHWTARCSQFVVHVHGLRSLELHFLAVNCGYFLDASLHW